MRRTFVFTAFIGAAMCASANAHPGSAILTTGSGERTVMTSGVSIEETGGVHLFRGTTAPDDHELLGGETATETPCEERIEVIVKTRPFRSLRRLRTQGFYSGVAYPSRRYTQGFYSGY